MNDLSAAAADPRRRCCDPIPPAVPCVLLPLLLAGLAVSVLILAIIHNALLLAALVLVSALVLAFLAWNAASFRIHRAVLHFLDRLPDSDLRAAADGQLVKITGFATCGDLSLESSYEKVGRCVYTSTLLYEYKGIISNSRNANYRCFQWNLSYLERFTADFYITDMKSGTRALVKAGYGSKVVPLVEEDILVNTTGRNRKLSATLKNWLEAKHLSAEARLLRLKEGYIMEGCSLTVMGMLSRKNGVLMVVPPALPISTGCLLHKLLLPVDIDGIVLRASDKTTYGANISQLNGSDL